MLALLFIVAKCFHFATIGGGIYSPNFFFLYMKRTIILSAVLMTSCTLIAEAQQPEAGQPVYALVAKATTAPDSLAGKQVLVNLAGAQEGSAAMNEEPTEWAEAKSSPMVVCFPGGDNNSFSYQMQESTPDTPWPPVEVSYNPQDAVISIAGNDMAVQVSLTFCSATEGTADITWHEEGGAWYVRGASFLITEQKSPHGLLVLPQAEEEDGAVQSVDDGLRELVLQLEQRQYKTAVQRLYQKRLLTLLPQIMEGGDVNTVLSNANGTTALHNACGLSCVEIVQWLVDHGADINAKTAKGASVDDCVGGPNAKAIRAILRKARNK